MVRRDHSLIPIAILGIQSLVRIPKCDFFWEGSVVTFGFEWTIITFFLPRDLQIEFMRSI